MNYAFSTKQIDYVHHLLTEHNMNVTQIAEMMATTIRNASHLMRLARQKYPKPHKVVSKTEPTGKKYFYDKIENGEVKEQILFVRPKAEYSNRRLYDLI